MSRSLKAKVIYDPSCDEFQIMVWSEGDKDWILDKSFPCVAAEDDPDGGKVFIHFQILDELRFLNGIGYKIQYGG